MHTLNAHFHEVSWREKHLGHSDLDRFTRTKVQNWISLVFKGRTARIQKKEGFIRTSPDRYGPSSSLSKSWRQHPLFTKPHFRGCWSEAECTKWRDFPPKVVRGLLGTGPPDCTLESASPSSAPHGSIWHRFDIDSTSISWFALFRCQIDPWGGEDKADSRVGSGGPVPNKPLTALRARILKKIDNW